MRTGRAYNFLSLFSPLDIVTILYILLSGIYIIAGANHLQDLLPHFTVRVGILFLIFVVAFLNKRYQENKLILFFKNLYPLLFLGFFYTETGYMKNIIFSQNLDIHVCAAEHSFWGCQPSLEFSKVMSQGWFNEIMNICYFSYYLITGVVCISLYLKKPLESYKGIFIVVFSFYMYYIVFAIFPVVGPQYHIPSAMETSEPPYFFGKIMHHIIANYEEPTGAFPSSHVGIAIILSYIAFKHLKKIFYISLPFVIGICFATVYLKAHYLLDVLAGILSVPVFIWLSQLVYKKLMLIKKD